MIDEDKILELGFVKVNSSYEKKYNYYMKNYNIVSITKHTDDNFPQFSGSYTIRIGGVIIKSECRDMSDIISINNCFTKIQCNKKL